MTPADNRKAGATAELQRRGAPGFALLPERRLRAGTEAWRVPTPRDDLVARVSADVSTDERAAIAARFAATDPHFGMLRQAKAEECRP